MYQTREIIDRKEWESFIDTHCITTFMQSWDFGVFENNTGHGVKRYAITDNNNILAVCQIIIIRAKKGSFLFVPHGPIIDNNVIPHESYQNENFDFSENQKLVIKNIFTTLYELSKKIAKQQKCSFIRYNTSLPNNKILLECIKYNNVVFAPIYLTSENGCVLNMSTVETDALLQNMRKTTRYSIKKAEKDGATVTQKPKNEFFRDFLKLYKETESREGFLGFSESYLRHEFEAFEQEGNSIALVSEVNSIPVAAGLFIKTKNCLFYHQGASNHPKVPAPYLLQWKAINIAKNLGCKYYNFWGTYIPGRTPKSWAGLSLFKQGFGTTTWSYMPTFDLVVDWKRYIPTYLIESFIRIRRGV